MPPESFPNVGRTNAFGANRAPRDATEVLMTDWQARIHEQRALTQQQETQLIPSARNFRFGTMDQGLVWM